MFQKHEIYVLNSRIDEECVVNTLVNYAMLQNEFGMNGIYCFFAMNSYRSSLVWFKLFLHIVRLDARKMTLHSHLCSLILWIGKIFWKTHLGDLSTLDYEFWFSSK